MENILYKFISCLRSSKTLRSPAVWIRFTSQHSFPGWSSHGVYMGSSRELNRLHSSSAAISIPPDLPATAPIWAQHPLSPNLNLAFRQLSQQGATSSSGLPAVCSLQGWKHLVWHLPRGRSKKSGKYKILYQNFNHAQLGGRLQTAKRQQVELQAWQTTPLPFKNCTKNGPGANMILWGA